MKFGIYSEEDLLQEAYLSVSRVIHKFDARKGKLFSFLYTHVNNRMKNLRRDKLERLTPPCAKCPLNAFCAVSGCQAYSDVMDCSYYRNWRYRNAAKKSLSVARAEPVGGAPPHPPDNLAGGYATSSSSSSSSSPPSPPGESLLETHEELARIASLLSEELAARLHDHLSGDARLTKRQYKLLVIDIQTEIWGGPVDLYEDEEDNA